MVSYSQVFFLNEASGYGFWSGRTSRKIGLETRSYIYKLRGNNDVQTSWLNMLNFPRKASATENFLTIFSDFHKCSNHTIVKVTQMFQELRLNEHGKPTLFFSDWLIGSHWQAPKFHLSNLNKGENCTFLKYLRLQYYL